MKRVLALLIALMLAIPGVAFSEDASIDETVIDDGVVLESVTIDSDPSIDATGLSGDGVGNIDLGGLLDPGLEAGLVSNAHESPAPVAFEQTAAVGDAGFTVTADAGAFPAEARLSVEAVDADVAQAAVQAIGSSAQGTHHLYAINVLDGNGNALRPADGVKLPLVRVEGLDLDGETRVFVYDRAINGSYEIEAEGTVQFRFRESAIYDIVDVKQPQQPAEEEQQPQQPADEGQQPSEEGQQPSEEGQQPGQPVEEEQQPQQPADEGQQPQQPSEEGQQPGQPAEEEQQAGQPAEEEQQAGQPVEEEQQPQQPAEEEQLEQEVELPADAAQEEDADEPVAFGQLDALNDAAYDINASNADEDLGASAANAENGEPVTEDERVKALEKLPKGNNGLSLDHGAYIDGNGSVRKIVLTQMDASLKNPVTGELIDAYTVPLKNAYIKVEDDVILIQASGAGLHEGDRVTVK